MSPDADIAVIGAGIAGASVAAELAETHRVLLLDAESQPGYHTTGRSAAVYMRSYGPAVIRALSRASGPFFEQSHPELDAPLLRRRGTLFVARADQMAALDAMEREQRGTVTRLDEGQARARMPLLRADYAAAALFDASAADIDVGALHGLYLRRLSARGGEVVTGMRVQRLERRAGAWQIEGHAGTLRAPLVVNAAGAWADEVGQLAGCAPLGLTPKRRTAVLIDAPVTALDGAPLVLDIDEQFYLKPDAGKLLISPADATPSAPCDAQPEELDVAVCVARIEAAFDLSIRRLAHRWAGLRSFVADSCPVAGFAPEADGFFWLAGQGGYGIQSAPALARSAAAILRGEPLPDRIAGEGVSGAALAPSRAALHS